jgi:hypothetical protein
MDQAVEVTLRGTDPNKRNTASAILHSFCGVTPFL